MLLHACFQGPCCECDIIWKLVSNAKKKSYSKHFAYVRVRRSECTSRQADGSTQDWRRAGSSQLLRQRSSSACQCRLATVSRLNISLRNPSPSLPVQDLIESTLANIVLVWIMPSLPPFITRVASVKTSKAASGTVEPRFTYTSIYVLLLYVPFKRITLNTYSNSIYILWFTYSNLIFVLWVH